METASLAARAREAAEHAYCPYSQFPVGAAVATDKGVFVGCNVENASYGLAVCAERVALFNAIAAGATKINALAVCCAKATEIDSVGSKMPCGACRQVIAEFMEADGNVIVEGAGIWRVSELLPAAFLLTEPSFLRGKRS